MVTPGWWLLGARASPLPTRVLATWVLPLGDNPASYDTVLIWGLFCLLFFNEKVYTAIQGNPKEGQAASVNGSTRSGLVPGAIAGEASASSRLDPATSFSPGCSGGPGGSPSLPSPCPPSLPSSPAHFHAFPRSPRNRSPRHSLRSAAPPLLGVLPPPCRAASKAHSSHICHAVSHTPILWDAGELPLKASHGGPLPGNRTFPQ